MRDDVGGRVPTALRIGLLTALTMIAFAGNSLLCRLALRDTTIDAATFTSVRLASGALILMAIVRLRGGGRPMASGNWPAAAMLFVYAAGFSFAYRELSAATGALILFGAVQLTMIGYGLWSGERLRGLQLAGLTTALAGLVYLLLPGLSAPPLRDAAFMLAAGMAWGVYSLLGRGSAVRRGAVPCFLTQRRRRSAGRLLRPSLRRGDLGAGLCAVVCRPAGAEG